MKILILTNVNTIVNAVNNLDKTKKDQLIELLGFKNNNNVQQPILQKAKDELRYTSVPDSIKKLNHKEQQIAFLGCFEEMIKYDEIIKKTSDDLELYKLRFRKIAAQQQILYEQFSAAKEEWRQERSKILKNSSYFQNEKEILEQDVKILQDKLDQFNHQKNNHNDNDDNSIMTDRVATLERISYSYC